MVYWFIRLTVRAHVWISYIIMSIVIIYFLYQSSLQWRHKRRDDVSPPSRLFTQPFIQAQNNENTKAIRVTGLCAGNSPVNGEFPAQMASNAENISIWWRHYVATHHIPTEYPKNCIHVLPFVMSCCGRVLVEFTPILQGCFTGTGAIVRLPQWSSPEEYG